MKKPSVSFVILTWNSQKYIKNCLDSIIAMSGIEKEIIVVENGSADDTVSILEKYSGDIKIIRLTKNIGTTRSRNMALRECSENMDYVCILDSDTVVNEKTFLAVIETLKSDKKIGLAGPAMYNLNGEYQISAKRFPTVKIKLYKAFPIKSIHQKGVELEKYDFTENRAYAVDHIISACWLIKKEAFKKVGIFDEKIFYAPEDNDYCMRVWKAGYKVVYLPHYSIIHDTQRLSKKRFFSYVNFLHIKGLVYYFCKHKYWFNAPNFNDSEEIKNK